MAVWLGSPPAAGARGSSRLMLLCLSGDRRRHQRRRDWDNTRRSFQQQQQQQQQTSQEVSDRLIINIEHVAKNAREALRRVARFGNDLVDECRATVRVSRDSGVTISLSRKPVEYAGFAAVLLLLLGLVARVVISSRSWRREKVVVRRDRSLGGKEVVVRTSTGASSPPRRKSVISLDEPALEPRKTGVKKPTPSSTRVPCWWDSSPALSSSVDNHDQARVNSLVRVIVEKRLSGKDFMEDDIVELRQICRTSGAKADFGTENTRDSLFRAAVAFVLLACSRSFVDYGGESIVSFICGLARNINLEASKAGSIINAAVAARTRSGFLQAWANVAQGKINEAEEEIRQIVSMHNVFPPEMNSPHMEMVGRGLESHLSLAERGELFNMYTKFSSKQNASAALEALGLPISYIL